MSEGFKCPICRRETPNECIEKHHGKPKCRGGKESILVCVDCGDMLHKLFTNKELDKKYGTVQSLLADDRVRKWASWVHDKAFGVCMKTKKRR